MPNELMTVKSGLLGNGCYIHTDLARRGLRRCQLPAWVVLELMDCGRWQLIGNEPLHTQRMDRVIDCYWRADADAIERAVLRLRSRTGNAFRERLARILMTLLPQAHPQPS